MDEEKLREELKEFLEGEFDTLVDNLVDKNRYTYTFTFQELLDIIASNCMDAEKEQRKQTLKDVLEIMKESKELYGDLESLEFAEDKIKKLKEGEA